MEVKTDRELLELAAKAAGIVGHFENNGKSAGLFLHDPENPSVWRRWNPLQDDGDALRLAVKLGIIVCVDYEIGICGIHLPGCRGKYDLAEELGDDPCTATRRAIVRAAAELARQGAE